MLNTEVCTHSHVYTDTQHMHTHALGHSYIHVSNLHTHTWLLLLLSLLFTELPYRWAHEQPWEITDPSASTLSLYRARALFWGNLNLLHTHRHMHIVHTQVLREWGGQLTESCLQNFLPVASQEQTFQEWLKKELH